ncbi:NUDIX domain-containing protein [Methylopila henanensis]|uniref:NUDIX domain-containing protein n=1 Tax=Methylopila henanensis TaxID=873516 RepID=A0ABW4K9I0_9HYPH
MTLGVRIVVIDGDGRVLLVRHGYAPGWHLPGGAVDPGETVAEAALRELREETGVFGEEADLSLLGMLYNPAFGGRDHVATFRLTAFRAGPEPAPNREIAERGWFPLDALPDGVTAATRRRLDEIAAGAPPTARW